MAESIIASFARSEFKYQLTKEQFQAFQPVLEQHFTQDEYGLHTICNLFYDTDEYHVIRHSIDKPLYKEKLRLRSYGVPKSGESKVFLEIKKKFDHVVYKRRISAPLDAINAFLTDGTPPPGADPQITKEISNFLMLHHPSAKVYICCDRIALFGKEDSSLRITLDRNLKWRTTDLDLRAGTEGQLILPEDITLMEIKFDNAMPLWLAHELSRCGIYKTSFSKIGTCFKQNIIPQIF